MHPFGQTVLGEFGEGAREGGFIWQLVPARETTDALKDSDPLWAKAHAESYAPQGAIDAQTLDQRDGGGQAQNSLGDKAVGQCAAIRGRASDSVPGGYEFFDPRPLQGVDQLRQSGGQSFDFLPKSGDEFFLDDSPPLQ
jgi:hypothetical protein